MSADPSSGADRVRTRFKFKDARTFALLSRMGLYVCAALAVLAAASGWAHRNLLEDIRTGAVTIVESDEDMNVRDVSEAREGILAIVHTLILVVTGVLALIWTYRANTNLRALANRSMEFTPGWAVGWYFVPIAALWKPYQMMRELWQRSAGAIDLPAVAPWYLILWWLSYNAMQIVDRISSRMYLRAKTPDAEFDALTVDIAGSVLALPAALLFARLIQRIQAMHDTLLDRNRAAGLLPAPQEAPWI